MSDLLNRIDLRFDFVTAKLDAHTITEFGCWEYQGSRQQNGYGRFTIHVPTFRPKKRKFMAHRVSFAYYNGVDPAAGFVCHRCDNPCCINPDHLYLGTAITNSHDMVERDRLAPQDGPNNHAAKLNEAMVLQIVEMIVAGETNKAIAEILPVTHAQVSLIRLGKSWRAVTEAANYDPEEYRRRRAS